MFSGAEDPKSGKYVLFLLCLFFGGAFLLSSFVSIAEKTTDAGALGALVSANDKSCEKMYAVVATKVSTLEGLLAMTTCAYEDEVKTH